MLLCLLPRFSLRSRSPIGDDQFSAVTKLTLEVPQLTPLEYEALVDMDVSSFA